MHLGQKTKGPFGQLGVPLATTQELKARMENSPGRHSLAHSGALKSGLVLIYKYI